MYMTTRHTYYHANAKNKRKREAKQKRRAYIVTGIVTGVILIVLVAARVIFHLPAIV